MIKEGKLEGQEMTFFEANGFRPFNFALLQKLNSITQSAEGYLSLQAATKDKLAERKLSKSLAELNIVVINLQNLLELGHAYNNAEATTIHPEKLFNKLHNEYAWPQINITTYQSLLVNVTSDVFVSVMAMIYNIERVPLKNINISFRRRGSEVIVRLFSPKYLWTKSQINNFQRKSDVCRPLMTDSLDLIVLKTCVCVLQKYQIKLSISSLQPNSLYIHMPAARQLQVFAEN